MSRLVVDVMLLLLLRGHPNKAGRALLSRMMLLVLLLSVGRESDNVTLLLLLGVLTRLVVALLGRGNDDVPRLARVLLLWVLLHWLSLLLDDNSLRVGLVHMLNMLLLLRMMLLLMNILVVLEGGSLLLLHLNLLLLLLGMHLLLRRGRGRLLLLRLLSLPQVLHLNRGLLRLGRLLLLQHDRLRLRLGLIDDLWLLLRLLLLLVLNRLLLLHDNMLLLNLVGLRIHWHRLSHLTQGLRALILSRLDRGLGLRRGNIDLRRGVVAVARGKGRGGGPVAFHGDHLRGGRHFLRKEK